VKDGIPGGDFPAGNLLAGVPAPCTFTLSGAAAARKNAGFYYIGTFLCPLCAPFFVCYTLFRMLVPKSERPKIRAMEEFGLDYKALADK